MKAAVIGLGRMGAEPSVRLEGIIPGGWLPISHAEAIINTPGVELVALCDADQQKVERFKTHYKVSYGYTDYMKMIDEVQPEFLSIATRTAIRKEIITYAAANAVKIIYAEKPLCTSLNDCDEILSLLAASKMILGYGVNRRYHDVYRMAKKILNSGDLGELKEIVVENGHSNLLWTHPHSTDLILYFAETTELALIQGQCSFKRHTPANEKMVDDDPFIEHGFFRFVNGVQAIISRTAGVNIRLACTKGNLTIHGDGKFIEIYSGDGYFHNRKVVAYESNRSATENLVLELTDAVLNRSLPPISHEEIRTGLLMLFGIVHSSLSGGVPLRPEDVPTDLVITGKSGSFFA